MIKNEYSYNKATATIIAKSELFEKENYMSGFYVDSSMRYNVFGTRTPYNKKALQIMKDILQEFEKRNSDAKLVVLDDTISIQELSKIERLKI